MIWALTAVTFFAVLLLGVGLIFVFTPQRARVAGRLSRLLDPVSPPVGSRQLIDVQKNRARHALTTVGKILPAASEQQASRGRLMMIRAGYRTDDATTVMRGVKIILPVTLVPLVYLTGFYRYNPFPILLGALIAGIVLPELWLTWRIKARQQRLRLALPDGLDLLVICVEVGLGMDQALLKVAQELRIVHPELSEELQMVNLEMRVGKSRVEAWRELARRTGLEDIKSLVAMLIQTERFGTSIASSLRIYSDELRTKRRQRAEEMSAKTTVKMVGPLVFFIFPALIVVILGPAIITLLRQMGPALK